MTNLLHHQNTTTYLRHILVVEQSAINQTEYYPFMHYHVYLYFEQTRKIP